MSSLDKSTIYPLNPGLHFVRNKGRKVQVGPTRGVDMVLATVSEPEPQYGDDVLVYQQARQPITSPLHLSHYISQQLFASSQLRNCPTVFDNLESTVVKTSIPNPQNAMKMRPFNNHVLATDLAARPPKDAPLHAVATYHSRTALERVWAVVFLAIKSQFAFDVGRIQDEFDLVANFILRRRLLSLPPTFLDLFEVLDIDR